MYLKQGGFGLLALKARSVDVTKKPKQLFKQVRAELEKVYTVVDYRELDPFEKDHAFFVVKRK
jgi:fibrillarin-like pre-rRNA processing protein